MTDLDRIAVLHVDDDRQFLEVSKSLLERARRGITVETATGADEGLAVLEREAIDCVVSDYKMPGTDGLAFLELVRECHDGLPFVLFTGQGSEEIASEAISAGVTDYLRKGGGRDRYAVLANRIENAVSARRATRRMRQAFQAIETAREGISILDEDGRFTFVNEAYADLYGYDPGDLLGRHWAILYREGDVESIVEEVFPQIREGGVWRGETVGRRADGSTFLEDHSLAITDSGGLICVVREREDAGEEGSPVTDEAVSGTSDPGAED